MNKISVNQLVNIIKDAINCQPQLQNVNVIGEIANLSVSKNGHIYFSLKDEQAKISCVMFSSRFKSLTFRPKDGTSVLINGIISVYQATGQIQINVLTMQEEGIGNIYQQYELLKEKLTKEGLFNSSNKKSITKYPEKVAVLVGLDSAASADVMHVFNRRWPICKVDIIPTIVQGIGAPSDITKNLEMIKNDNSYDFVIICRGGGSFEDLNCFNDERLIRYIYKYPKPIISGIGHESDFTLIDFVSDLRAPTPTAAVELTTPDIKEVIKDFNIFKERMEIGLSIQINNNHLSLNYIKQNLINSLNRREKEVIIAKELFNKFDRLGLTFKHNQDRVLESYKVQLEKILENNYNRSNNDLKRMEYLLDALSPLKVLSRGYSLTYKNDKLVRTSDEVNIGDKITVCLNSGRIESKVVGIDYGKEI